MLFLKFLERIPDLLLPNLEAKNHTLYIAWREVVHLVGSLFLLGTSHLLMVATSLNIPFVTLMVLVVWLIYQEAYRHPKIYGQRAWKGVLDVAVWVVPFILYLLFF